MNIFLIDSNFTIYKTTFIKDLNLNLSQSKYVVDILNKSKLNNEIYSLDKVKFDVLDMKYKGYVYSKLDENSFLELAFVDKSIKNLFLEQNASNQKKYMNIELYDIRKRKDYYIHSQITKRNNFSSKISFLNSLEHFYEDKPTKNNIMNAYFHDEKITIKENGKYIVFAPLYKKSETKNLHIKNIIGKFTIDISNKLDFLKTIEIIFINIFLITIILLYILFMILKYQLEFPIKIITKSIKDAKKIPMSSFKNTKNEFYKIATSYNELYENLNLEIKKNHDLLLIDHLTNAKNRKAFDYKYHELFDLFRRYETSFCIMLFDIDNFKNINDNLGHLVGDEVLIKISGSIQKMLRKTDFLYRVGGDEFMILCSQTKLPQAYKVAKKIQKAIKEEFENSVTLSIGITQVKKTDDEQTLYERVDLLQYNSKKQGKNKITIDKYYN